MNLLNLLNWRYATKKFDPSKIVAEDKIERILEAVRLTATSSGLQPYEVIVVKNPELRQKLQAVGWNQAQITEASHLLVFAAWDNYTADRINMMFDLVNTERGFVNEGWEAYRKQVLASYTVRDAETNYQHAARQAYIGVGTALVAAAAEEVDSTPMEGFDAAAVDEILGLKQLGLRSVVMLPLGYRQAEGDWLVKLNKVRRAKKDFVREI